MKFKLEIKMRNATMQTVEDIAQALRDVANKLERGCTSANILDINGNVVGTFKRGR